MSTNQPASNRLFDAILERQSTIFDAVRSNNERTHRFTRSVIESTRQNSHDWTEVGRRWLARPTDLMGLYEASSEAIGNSQTRMLALTREWIDDIVESQRESREMLRQGLGDVRGVVEQAQANVPAFLRRNNWGRRNDSKPEPAREQRAS